MNSHTRHLGQVELGGLEAPGSGEPPRRKGLLRFAVIRYRGTIAIGMFIGALLGFLYGAGQPNTYEAAGKMLFQTGMREAANAELVVGESVSASRTDAQSIATEMQILESPEIYQKVLETVGVERLIATPDPRRVDTESTPLPVVCWVSDSVVRSSKRFLARSFGRTVGWWIGGSVVKSVGGSDVRSCCQCWPGRSVPRQFGSAVGCWSGCSAVSSDGGSVLFGVGGQVDRSYSRIRNVLLLTVP